MVALGLDCGPKHMSMGPRLRPAKLVPLCVLPLWWPSRECFSYPRCVVNSA